MIFCAENNDITHITFYPKINWLLLSVSVFCRTKNCIKHTQITNYIINYEHTEAGHKKVHEDVNYIDENSLKLCKLNLR